MSTPISHPRPYQDVNAMSTAVDQASLIIPAQLSYLVIYNPSLGKTDENVSDQIVFYTSRKSKTRRKLKKTEAERAKDEEREKNERLRQVGLAQGIVAFGRDFAQNDTVSSVDTLKSRVILHELEDGWWILAVGAQSIFSCDNKTDNEISL
jgi:First Longin domain of INTU, CCZ1 and HPS4